MFRGSQDYGGKFAKVEENFNILQTGLRDIQGDNHDKVYRASPNKLKLKGTVKIILREPS